MGFVENKRVLSFSMLHCMGYCRVHGLNGVMCCHLFQCEYQVIAWCARSELTSDYGDCMLQRLVIAWCCVCVCMVQWFCVRNVLPLCLQDAVVGGLHGAVVVYALCSACFVCMLQCLFVCLLHVCLFDAVHCMMQWLIA